MANLNSIEWDEMKGPSFELDLSEMAFSDGSHTKIY